MLVNPFPLAVDVLDAPAEPELRPLFAAAFARRADPMDRAVVASVSAAGKPAQRFAEVLCSSPAIKFLLEPRLSFKLVVQLPSGVARHEFCNFRVVGKPEELRLRVRFLACRGVFSRRPSGPTGLW